MALNYGNQSKSYLEKLVQYALNNPKAIGYEKLTVGGTAVALTVPAETIYCEITLESTNNTTVAVRYLLLGDKTLPTATDGKPLTNLVEFNILDYQNISSFRAIQTAAGTHTLHIQYFK